MKKITLTELSIEELVNVVENAVVKVVDKLPKRRTKPYTKKEARDLFQVTYPTLARWENKDLLERIEQGGRVYYTVASVEKCMSER